MSKNIYIIIVTYNSLKWIDKCLSSCKGHQVVVIDNNSTDKTVSFIQENFPEVHIIQQQQNLGFGQANNIGISYALKQDCEYVFLLNQDAYLQNDVIEKLTKVHQENSEFGILSPIHLNGKGDKLDRNFSYYIAYDKNPNFYFDAIINNFKTVYSVPFVNAAAWLLSRKTLEDIGGFDPLFYHYGEDDNYCQRLLFHNLKIGIVPETYILHDREHRGEPQLKTTEEKLKLKERQLKNKWANINISFDEEIEKSKRKLNRTILKLTLKLKTKQIKYFKEELELINNIEKPIIKSRDLNKQKGSHYLDL